MQSSLKYCIVLHTAPLAYNNYNCHLHNEEYIIDFILLICCVYAYAPHAHNYRHYASNSFGRRTIPGRNLLFCCHYNQILTKDTAILCVLRLFLSRSHSLSVRTANMDVCTNPSPRGACAHKTRRHTRANVRTFRSRHVFVGANEHFTLVV